MDSLFKKKSNSRSSQGTDVGFSSQPYDRTSAMSTPPTTGSNSRFVSFVGQSISAPNTNDKLTNEGGAPLNRDIHRARIVVNESARESSTSLESEPERLARTGSVTSTLSAPSIRRVAAGQRMDTLSEFGGRQQHLGLPATPASTTSSPSHRPGGARRDSEQGSIRSVASGSSRHILSMGLGDSAPYPPHPRAPSQSQSHTSNSRASRSSSNAGPSPAPGQPLFRADSHYAPSTYSTDSFPASTNGADGMGNFTPPNDEEDLNRRLREAYRKLNGVDSGKLRVGHDKEGEMLARPFEVKLKILQQVEQLCSKLESESGSGKHPPEWYLQAIANGYATVKDILDLKVQLRTGQIPWFRSFCDEHHGVVVISKTLAAFQDGRTATKTGDRSQDMQKENELIKTIRVIANNSVGLRAINDSRNVLPSIIALLTSPIVQNRQVANEILMALIDYSRTSGLKSVQEAFAIRNTRLREVDSQIRRYTPWLTALERTLDGRGRMGSLVGASPDMKRAVIGQDLTENTFNDYCFFSMCLINHLVRGAPPKSDSEELEHGFELRVGVRMELEASGVESVINKLSMLNIQSVNGELQTYREMQEEDNRLATREYDRAILRSLKNPQDVFNGIMKNVSGTRTQETFLGIMRYLMLIKDDGDRRERNFELVQMLVRSAVMDGKDGVDRDFNSVVSRTVQQCLSKLDESHLLEQAREENKGLKSRIIKLQRDKETMTAELGERDEGLVGHLKSQLAQTEEKLKVSRGLAETGKGEMDEIRLRYQEDIELLDNDLHELYTMLLETGMLEEVVGDDEYRTALVSRLEAQFERRKTIKILEGRHKKRGGAKKRINGDSHFSEDDTDDAGEEDVEDGKVFVADKVALLADKGKENALDSTRREKVVSGSQFMDAEDDRVRAHIESRLASEDEISPSRSKGGLPRSARTRDIAGGSKSPLTTSSRPPIIGQKSPGRYANIARAPGLSRVVAELKGRHSTIMRSSSAPADMVAERDSNSATIEFRAFNTLTDHTAVTSVGSIANQDVAGAQRHGAEELASSLKEQIAHRAQDSQESKSPEVLTGQISAVDDEEEYPPPPTPPPMPLWLTAGHFGSSDDAAPPPPPPPPPMPGRPGMASPFGPGGAGLLAGIAGGVKLRKAGDGAAPRAQRRVSKRFETSTLSVASENRKAVEMTASKRMKQLQWEKLNKMHTDNTIWDKSETPEVEMAAELQKKNIFSDMEDEFKAREIANDAMSKKKKEELKSVLEPSVRKRVEILMARTRRLELEPEQMCDRIVAFDPELCDSTFLFELQPVLPTPEQISLLKQQNAETPDELLLIHPADRLMIRLIKIPHLADRLKGMQYKVNFEETIALLEKAVNLLQQACDDLQSAKQFKALLNVILMMGNYINGSNYAGGAWGFKMSSINRLVDTKSMNGQNLLHFLEKTISQHFPHIEGFLDELERPAEAYRVSYEELSSGTRELNTGLSRIRSELEMNFVNLNDGYARRMFPFVADAEERVLTLRDRVLAAGKSFNEVKAYYGEGDDRFDPSSSAEFFGRPTSLEFFGTFKTFITSYNLCRAQNKVRDDAKASLEKRKLMEETRKKPSGFLSPQTTGASDKVGIMDDLTARLRKQGTPRANRTDRRRYDAVSSPIDESFDWSAFGVDGDDSNSIAEAARRMLSGLDDTVAADTLGLPESPTKGKRSAPELTLESLALTLPEADPFLATFDLVDGAESSREAPDLTIQESKSPSSTRFSSPTKSRFAAATPELPALPEE